MQYSLISPRRVYVRKLKGTSEFDLKNRCLFLKNGSLFSAREFEQGSLFLKIGVGKWSLFSKIGVEKQNLFLKIGV